MGSLILCKYHILKKLWHVGAVIFLLFVMSGQSQAAQRDIDEQRVEYLLQRANTTDKKAKYQIYKESDKHGFIFREEIRFMYLEEAARLDYLPAILDLAQEKRKQKKYKEEVEWLERGVQLGSGEAMCRLAANYQNGEGVAQNIDYAKQLLNRAIDVHYIQAKAVLRQLEGKTISPVEAFFEDVSCRWYSFHDNENLFYRISLTFYGSLLPWLGLAFQYLDIKWWISILIFISTLAIPGLFIYLNVKVTKRDETRNRYFRPFVATWLIIVCGAIGGLSCILGDPDSSFFWVLLFIMGVLMLYGILSILFFSKNRPAILVRLPPFLIFSVIGYFIGIALSVLMIVLIAILIFSLGVAKGRRSVPDNSVLTTPTQPEEPWCATVKDEHGYQRKLKDTGLGSYEDDQGRRWKDDGWNRVRRDD